MMSLSNKKISCLCGGIKLTAYGKFRHVSNCHCVQCMKTHGNYASYTRILEKNMRFISKKTLKWFRSSKKAKRGFCRRCGASIFFKRIGSNSISISAGMFKNPTKLKTEINIYTKGKLDYYKLDKKLPKFQKLPKFYRYSD